MIKKKNIACILDKDINLDLFLNYISKTNYNFDIITFKDYQLKEDLISKLRKNPKIKNIKDFKWSDYNNKYYLRWHSHRDSFDNINEFKTKNKSYLNMLLILLFKFFYKSNYIAFFIDKFYLLKLHNYFDRIRCYNFLQTKYKKVIPFFLLNREIKKINIVLNLIKLNKLKKFSKFNYRKIFFNTIFKNLKFYLLIILYPLYSLLTIRKINIRKQTNFSYGIRISNSGYFPNRFHNSLLWMVDQNKFNIDKLLLVIEDNISSSQLESIRKSGIKYVFCNKKNPIKITSINFILYLLFLVFPINLLLSILIIFSDLEKKELYFEALNNFIKWNNFNFVFKIFHYFTIHNYQPEHILRNIIFNKNKIKTISIKQTFSESIYDVSNTYYNNVMQAYNYFKFEFHWGNESVRMSNLNESKSENIMNAGIIWADKNIICNTPKTINDFLIKNKNKIFIGMFTTALNLEDGDVNDVKSHLGFLLFAKDLLKKNDDYRIIIKTKYNITNIIDKNVFPEITNAVNELNNSGKVMFIYNYPRASILINKCDITISMPFTSSLPEAIVQNKKSFFLDINNNFEKSYYEKFNYLIAHNSQQGFKFFDHWINVNENDFKKYSLSFKEDFGISNIINSTDFIKKIIL